MFSKVLKSSLLWFLTTALMGCSDDKETPCSYQSQPKSQLQFSSAPETLGLSFPQQKLVEMMWTSPSQSECFVRRNGNVNLFRVQNEQPTYRVQGESSAELENSFVLLKPAPQASQETWRKSEEQLKIEEQLKCEEDLNCKERLNSEENLKVLLLGLTSFAFYSLPTERVVSAEILLRSDSRPWHLWHEYTHFLIGQFRVQATDLSLRNPVSDTVRDALNDAVSQTEPEEFQKKFSAFSDLQLDYMQKEFLDEVLIETTLQELISQAKDLLPVDELDFEESQRVVERFKEEYNSYFERQQQVFADLQPQLSSERQDLLQKHIERLEKQRTALLTLLD
jgi:hypothetical protein